MKILSLLFNHFSSKTADILCTRSCLRYIKNYKLFFFYM